MEYTDPLSLAFCDIYSNIFLFRIYKKHFSSFLLHESHIETMEITVQGTESITNYLLSDIQNKVERVLFEKF